MPAFLCPTFLQGGNKAGCAEIKATSTKERGGEGVHVHGLLTAPELGHQLSPSLEGRSQLTEQLPEALAEIKMWQRLLPRLPLTPLLPPPSFF